MNEFVRIDAALADAVARLDQVSDSPRLDAELLLARALDVPRSYLFAHPEDSLDAAALERFVDVIDRRADGVPLAYITGEKEFWSMTFFVNPDTLVPRPETEILVDQALTRIPRRATLKILDLGTGSGAIAAAIAKERPLCELTATDLSSGAITTAQENARHNTLPNIEFMQGSWFEPVAGMKFDMVVSNPPYIPDAHPDLETLSHEPRSALAAGSDGLDAIRHIAAHASSVMNAGGILLLEHGDRQSAEVTETLQKEGWTDITVANDLSGRPRVTIAVSR